MSGVKRRGLSAPTAASALSALRTRDIRGGANVRTACQKTGDCFGFTSNDEKKAKFRAFFPALHLQTPQEKICVGRELRKPGAVQEKPAAGQKPKQLPPPTRTIHPSRIQFKVFPIDDVGLLA